jgi:hypothetical protein
MDSGARLLPVYMAGRDLFAMSFGAVLEFDIEQITAEHNRYAVKRIAVPGRGLSRRKAKSQD